MMSLMLVIVLVFECFPLQIGSIYNIASPSAAALAKTGFRVFSLVHLFRATVLFLMYYYSSGGYKKLALSVSVLDSFLVIPVAMLLCRFTGINGLWAAFSLTAVLCLLWIAAAAVFLNRRQAGRTTGLLLLPVRTKDVPVFDATIEDTPDNAEALSASVISFLRKNGCRDRICIFSGVLTEELAVYIMEQTARITFLDVLIKVYDDKISMYFRSDGQPLSGLNRLEEWQEKAAAKAVRPEHTALEAGSAPAADRAAESTVLQNMRNTETAMPEAEIDGNFPSPVKRRHEEAETPAAEIDSRLMLQKLSDRLDYARLLGMNSVMIELRRSL